MKKVDLLIEKTKRKGPGIEDIAYWFNLEHEVEEFLNDPENSEEDKHKLKYLGCTESLYMICRGIEWMDEQERQDKPQE